MCGNSIEAPLRRSPVEVTWSRDRLSKRARHRVRDARSEAISLLLRDVAVNEAAALRLAAGLPDGTEAVDMASALFARIV